MTSQNQQASLIATFLRRLHRNRPFEIRCLGCKRGGRRPFVVAGYFDNIAAAANAILGADSDFSPDGIYTTLNEIDPALMARAMNRLIEYPAATTNDANIVHRRRILLDFDPVRPSGISATGAEVELAVQCAMNVKSFLGGDLRWPDPMIELRSGNGAHLIYAVNLPNDAASTELIRRVLTAISDRFSDDHVKVDEAVFNAARITKVAGTWARKGDDTGDRPHRQSSIIYMPERGIIVSRAKLEAAAALTTGADEPPSDAREGCSRRAARSARTNRALHNSSGHRLKVDEYLAHYGVAFELLAGVDDQGRTRYALAQCPFHGDHGGRDSVVYQGPNGELGFHCFHDRCAGMTWQDVKSRIGQPLAEHYDPPLAENAFRNYEAVGVPQSEGVQVTFIGRDMWSLAAELFSRTGGFPKRVEDRLFAEAVDGSPLWLRSATDLFAWCDGQFRVDWQRGSDRITQERFFAHLEMTAESCNAVETLPHFPRIPGVYYLHPELPESNGSYFQQLVDRFCPATPVDRQLIRAFFLTLFWGGKPGARPGWVITGPLDDPRCGRGVGKSTLAEVAGDLAGGFIEIAPQEEIAKVKTRLLSSGARGLRLARLDNVKTSRLSWADLEGLITSPTISGHRLYQGEGQRPNTITWTITINGGMLSSDLAQRCVVIRLARPVNDANWSFATREFVRTHRWQIIADIIALLEHEEE